MDLSTLGTGLNIVGALAFFIYGMKTMSDGIQLAAGSQMRAILRRMTQNPLLGVLSGFLITALIQSSSATTVMTVSFVNAGLLSLTESAGVMIGANVGTTITAWIVSVLGFKIKLSTYSIPLFGLGVPMIIMGRGKVKYWGHFIVGFALLFLGLYELRSSIPSIEDNPALLEQLKDFTEWGFFSRILFLLVGTVLTIVLQSSSASTAITLTMCAEGWLPFEAAAAMVLGENIGTTTTAELAALVANTSARRAARIHSLFNLFGVAWMVLLLPVFLPFMVGVLERFLDLGGDPYTEAAAIPMALAAFHTSFNMINVLLVLPLVPWLVRAASYTVPPTKQDQISTEKLRFIPNANLTPELSTGAVQKETAHFGEVVSRMNKFSHTLINSIDQKEKIAALQRLYKYESISDMIEMEITKYITRITNQEITEETSIQLRGYMNVANDLERISDIYFQIAKALEHKMEERIYFLPEQRQGINRMLALIDRAFQQMIQNLSAEEPRKITKAAARQIEQDIDKLRNELRSRNLDRLGSEDYKVKGAMVYNNIFSALERIGDHIMNVTESVVGEI